MLASISAYTLSIWLHVSAVVVGFGSTFAEALMFPVAMSVDKRHLPYVHKLGIAINQRLATPALALILITGIYQTAKGDWKFGSFWISATFLIVIVLGGLLGAYFIPTDRRLAALVERDIAASVDGEIVLSQEYQDGAKRIGAIGALAGFLVIVAVFLMVTKPGA
jgi:predicted integral membrane protein DUF2269